MSHLSLSLENLLTSAWVGVAHDRRTVTTDNEGETRLDKRACTSSGSPCTEAESGSGDSAADASSDSEVELLETRSQGSLMKHVSIHLADDIKAAPKGWNSSQPQRQLTFHDLKWKPLKTDEEKALQWKRMAQLDKDMFQEVRVEEEKKKAQQKVHKCELAAKRQQRLHDRRRALAIDKVKGCHQSINTVSVFRTNG